MGGSEPWHHVPRRALAAEGLAWGERIQLPEVAEAHAPGCAITVHLQTPAGLATCCIPLLELQIQAGACVQDAPRLFTERSGALVYSEHARQPACHPQGALAAKCHLAGPSSGLQVLLHVSGALERVGPRPGDPQTRHASMHVNTCENRPSPS